MPRQIANKVVKWLSDQIDVDQKTSITFRHYEKFQFKDFVGEIGDYVLVSNADSAEPDTEAGCDAARIVALYEDTTNNSDPFRAKVQWYSRPDDVPKSCINNNVKFLDREVLEDHRPFDTDVSIETFFKKCSIMLTYTKDTEMKITAPYHYICRYRLIPITRKKVQIEPVLEEERKALQLLSTPAKKTPSKTPNTPTGLSERMSRVSISEQRNWSVSKNDGTKLLLKRAILADKTEKESPKKVTPRKTKTPISSKNVTINNIEKVLSMELQENSDDELPTLIIRQHVSTPPKKKNIQLHIDEIPRKTLQFDDDKDTPSRATRNKSNINYWEPELSPVKKTSSRISIKPSITYTEPESPEKRTPRRALRKTNEDSDEDFQPVPKTPKTPRTRTPKTTPEKTPKKKVISQLTPTLHIKVKSVDNVDEKRTPRRALRKINEDSDEDFQLVPKTPKTPRTPNSRTPRATPGKTPKRKIISQLTPTLHTRVHSVDNVDEFLKENRSLPGREQQLEEILSFVRTKLIEGTSGCMYISGVPGTGKTATVCSALKILKEQTDLPDFQLVEVNGMKITEPRQAYVQIYKQLTGKSVVWEQACTLLDKRFTNRGPRRTPTVILVDELDALCTRRQDVLYSIMEWAAHNSALLTVLAVANTMDLPERALAARVASRLGLTRLTFPPYTHTQLQTIVASRLAGANVTADALQLIARKVAAVSGDARRALALSARALELARGSSAGLAQVQAALGEAASGAAVRAIHSCAPAERLMLRAVAAEVERTGSDETTLSRALATAAAIVALDGRPYRSMAQIRAPTPSQALALCASLAASRLILLEPKPAEPRLLLNVSVDDVHYATREITI